MLRSLALIFLVGLLMGSIFNKLKLPSLLGMIITGMILSPYALNLLDPSIMGISADLRQVALVVILTRAGISLNIEDLKKVGRPAILMCFVPACFEIVGVILIAVPLIGVSITEAAIMGSVLAAGALAVFFGGTILDGAMAAAFAVGIWLVQMYFAPICTNNILFNFLCSFATGVLIGLAGHVLPIHEDKVMIGDIMLLIPGLALTNAVKDMFVGDTITGSLRLVESVLWAAGIACGFALAVFICR